MKKIWDQVEAVQIISHVLGQVDFQKLDFFVHKMEEVLLILKDFCVNSYILKKRLVNYKRDIRSVL